ncbi:M16 family metallopeptidase [Thermonema rossianum]|uniref:M16 family metallopeptidase n=1 Tax=Thermonema rossianum TaxID=55505 RepID=UPI0005709185|nr:pitrilysin family protein [Thermonema rossianum]
MTTLDRTQAPPIFQIDSINILLPEKKLLSNGIPVYLVIDESSELVYFQLIVQGGNCAGTHVAQAQLHSRMLLEGSKQYTAEQINELIDYHGANIGYSSYTTYSQLSVSALAGHLPALIPMLHDSLAHATFPSDRFELQKKRFQQSFITALEKNSYVAARAFKKAVFGDNHPYGRLTELQDIEQTTENDLHDYHQRQIHAGNMMVVAAGAQEAFIMEQLERLLGSLPVKSPFSHHPTSDTPAPKACHLEGPQHLQSSIYAGRVLPSPQHPDYHKLVVTDTLLGGYFGSRLMQNLREDKGYTYGVHSYIQEFPDLSLHTIATEVGAQHTRDALREIRHELLRLSEAPPAIEEVHTVQLHLISQFINSFSNMFRRVDTFARLLKQGSPFDSLTQYLQRIRAVLPGEVQQTAASYFLPDMLHWISVGPDEQA